MNRFALTAVLFSLSATAWADPKDQAVKSDALKLLRALAPVAAIAPSAPQARLVALARSSVSQTSWTMREADELFSRGTAFDHKKILGIWTRVAQVDHTDRNNGRIDMKGLNADADGGRITFSKKDNPVQSYLLYAQIHGENDSPVLADPVPAEQFSNKTKILGKTTKDRATQAILNQRAYWCVQANPEIVLCEVDTLDGGRSDGSGSIMLFEYYAYARIQ
ncbi:MAG: hypothetical protein Q7T82_20190 [Armatimonadota bacterium]|nr:hypothetical protein [Armatimonadota bacterium]